MKRKSGLIIYGMILFSIQSLIGQDFSQEQAIQLDGLSNPNIFSTDIDNDGDKDLLCSSRNNRKVVWYENEGDGIFSPQNNITIDFFINSMYPADLDGDNYVDVVCSNNIDNNVVWFKNDRNGSFTGPYVLVSNLAIVFSIFASDLDNDGDLDIITASNNNIVSWHKNNGSGNIQSSYILSSNTTDPINVYATDINGDNNVDIFSVSSDDNTISWYRNEGLGNFSDRMTISDTLNRVSKVVSADLDNDQDEDILFIYAKVNWDDNLVAWYENDGNGNFIASHLVNDSLSSAQEIHIADLNSDGKLDILIGHYQVILHNNEGSGNFADAKLILSGQGNRCSVITDDIDRDGDLDVVAGFNSRVAWLSNEGNEVFDNPSYIVLSLSSPREVYIEDLNGDNNLDVFSIGPEKVWYRNDSTGQFRIKQLLGYLNSWDAVGDVGDVDNDGDLDIVIGHNLRNLGGVGTVILHYNNGLGLFSEGDTIAISNEDFETLCLADMNNDNSLDILYTQDNRDDIIYLENDLNGGFNQGSIIQATYNQPEIIQTGDIDNDGDLDIFTTYWVNGGVGVIINNGDGSYEDALLVNTGVGATKSFILKDIDKDGYLDLFIGTNGGGIVGVINNGNGSFGPVNLLTSNSDYKYIESLTISDLDNDGELDLVALSQKDQIITWYKNNGFPNFSNEEVIANDIPNLSGASPNLSNVIAKDLDHDGFNDIVFSTSHLSRLSWFKNLLGLPQMKGHVFYDLNNNGIKEGNENGMPGVRFRASSSNSLKYSDENGNLKFRVVNSLDSLIIEYNEIWSLSTNNDTVILATLDSNSDTIFYGLTPIAFINDLSINISSGLPRCNREVPFQIVLTNTGTTILEGTLETTNIDMINYVDGSSNPAPNSINNGHFNWAFNDLYPGSSFVVNLNFEIDGPPDISVGDQLCLNAMVTILTESNEETTYIPPTPTGETDLVNICHCTGSGVNPYVVLELPYSAVDGQGNYDHANHGCDIIPITDLNNDGNIDEQDCLFQQTSYTETTFLGSYCTEIRCSFDPNDKAANPAGESDENYTLMGQDIIYTIRFQNTGNDTAFRVELIDTLSENLNVSTFDFITSSHRPIDITIESITNSQKSVLKFLFEDILLPDSTVDEPGSNGFVQFSIRPKFGLPEPTVLTNSAGIYFDLNPPVITNLVDHTLVYTIPDYRAPEAVCKSSIEVFLDENGNATITAEQLDLASTDNVGVESFEVNQSSFNCSDLGNNSIQLTVFDAVGNTDVCNTLVLVKDEIEPTVICEDITLIIEEGETITLTPEEVTTVISDNCSIQSSSLSQTTFSQTDAGSNTIQLTVVDFSGNQTICDVNVEVTIVSNLLENVYGVQATIAPNPFSNYTVLTFNKVLPFNFDVKVVDITGKTMQEYTNQNQQQITIENQNWASGIYLLNVFESGQQNLLGSYKLVIE
jgi:uncharacterized repeat protein (TIGR01451 family)